MLLISDTTSPYASGSSWNTVFMSHSCNNLSTGVSCF